MINCNECKFINITQEEQLDKSKDHRCSKYDVKVIHRSSVVNVNHNYIYPCEKCKGKDFIKRL